MGSLAAPACQPNLPSRTSQVHVGVCVAASWLTHRCAGAPARTPHCGPPRVVVPVLVSLPRTVPILLVSKGKHTSAPGSRNPKPETFFFPEPAPRPRQMLSAVAPCSGTAQLARAPRAASAARWPTRAAPAARRLTAAVSAAPAARPLTAAASAARWPTGRKPAASGRQSRRPAGADEAAASDDSADAPAGEPQPTPADLLKAIQGLPTKEDFNQLRKEVAQVSTQLGAVFEATAAAYPEGREAVVLRAPEDLAAACGLPHGASNACAPG